MVVRVADKNVRTLPAGGVDGHRRDLDKDFILANCRDARVLSCLDRLSSWTMAARWARGIWKLDILKAGLGLGAGGNAYQVLH